MLPSPQRKLLRSVFKKRLFLSLDFASPLLRHKYKYVEIIFRRNIDEKINDRNNKQRTAHNTFKTWLLRVVP